MPESLDILDQALVADDINVKAGAGIYWRSFAQPLANLGTSAATAITWTPGHRFKILAVQARTSVAGTGASASQVLTTKINATAMTGGVLTLTLANQQTTYGQNVDATTITAGNAGDNNDVVTVDLTASGTAFSAGQIDLQFKVQNLEG
jgi:hypothetical protein